MMATTKEYAAYILDQFGTPDVTSRKMMGEYVLYHCGKVFGGLYDNRLLVKITDASRRLMPDAVEELPYESGKPMLLVERVDEPAFLQKLAEEMDPELALPRKRKPQGKVKELPVKYKRSKTFTEE